MRTRPTLAVTLLTTLTMIAALAIVSRADADPPEVRTSSIGPVTLPCAKAQRAIGYYRQKYAQHRQRMSLTGPVARVWYGCKVAQRRAVEWRARARDAAAAVEAWVAYHHDWPAWLPDKWQRIGACETGYGRRPGNWRHWNSGYEGAFGFAHSSWDGFVGDADPKAGPYPASAAQATPRQQYEVALAIYRRYGLSGWGCRGA